MSDLTLDRDDRMGLSRLHRGLIYNLTLEGAKFTKITR